MTFQEDEEIFHVSAGGTQVKAGIVVGAEMFGMVDLELTGGARIHARALDTFRSKRGADKAALNRSLGVQTPVRAPQFGLRGDE